MMHWTIFIAFYLVLKLEWEKKIYQAQEHCVWGGGLISF